MKEAEILKVFVYGTLKQGERNYAIYCQNKVIEIVDILTRPKRAVIPKPHNLGFCFNAVAFRDLLSSGLTLAPQTDTACPAAKMF